MLDYMVDHGLVAAGSSPKIQELGGGISNVVIRVEYDGDRFVMKQSLPKLRVADDWPFDRKRIFRERACMTILADMLPRGTVPEIRFHDDENFLFTMSCAPSGAVLWKQSLMAGDIRATVAQRAGELLSQIHNLASRDARIAAQFSDPSTFIEGRVDPYHWTAAAAHPDLASVIRRETDRLLATRLVLVHGDFSPKNIFVLPGRTPQLLLLDFEVVHFGDPAFDVAFCLTHFLLKGIRFPEWARQYVHAAKAFWQAYRSHLLSGLDQGIDWTTTRELGCILLARIDGKSKIEYISAEPMRDIARQLARKILLMPDLTVDAALEIAAHAVSSQRIAGGTESGQRKILGRAGMS